MTAVVMYFEDWDGWRWVVQEMKSGGSWRDDYPVIPGHQAVSRRWAERTPSPPGWVYFADVCLQDTGCI